MIIRAIGPSIQAEGARASRPARGSVPRALSGGQRRSSGDEQRLERDATGRDRGHRHRAEPGCGIGHRADFEPWQLHGRGERRWRAAVGIGLVEVYDLAATQPAKLANIATRGFVDRGDNVMIGGFIIGGGLGTSASGTAKLLIRALGPSLGAAGVANSLANPTLELVNSNGDTLATNDNWRDTPASRDRGHRHPALERSRSRHRADGSRRSLHCDRARPRRRDRCRVGRSLQPAVMRHRAAPSAQMIYPADHQRLVTNAMRTSTHVCVLLFASALTLLGQGALTPPGPPGADDENARSGRSPDAGGRGTARHATTSSLHHRSGRELLSHGQHHGQQSQWYSHPDCRV